MLPPPFLIMVKQHYHANTLTSRLQAWTRLIPDIYQLPGPDIQPVKSFLNHFPPLSLWSLPPFTIRCHDYCL